MKNLAELKRMADQYKWQLLESSYKGVSENHKYLNVVRKVIKKQTNSIQLEGGSWLTWGKASEYKFAQSDLPVVIIDDNTQKLIYKLIPLKGGNNAINY